MRPHTPAPRTLRRPFGQRGVSLIEIMVSITIGLLLLAGMSSLYVNQSRTQTNLDRVARMIENGRYALQILADDLQVAGFYGEYTPPVTAATLPDPCNVAVAGFNEDALAHHVQGVNNATTASTPSCLPAVVAGSDILVIRRLETNRVAHATLPSAGGTTRYMQTSLCAPSPGFAIGLNRADLGLFQRDCASAADVRRLMVRIYFLSPDNLSGDGIPTLKRAELGTSGSFATEALVEGVQNMQVSYGRDSDGDGEIDLFDSCSACDQSAWPQVVAVRLHLLTRNLEPTSGYADNKSYRLGDVTVAGGGDGYKRHVYSEFVRLNNPAGRRE